ncbi:MULTISPECIES: HugZ family pyridoxamine 5'-phosphate oxidase [unclassified Xanthobacter]|uniref:HugZ family pyridoxamine 5'-phosphate oxidase n=1 Tax=unclassified Xanthobacter TaxID=2623496 RepID=UPI001EDD8C23
MTQTASEAPSVADTAAATVRRLIREARFGTLATLDADGGPYASLVAVGTDPEGRPTLLISQLARHTQNIARDARVSLLVSAAEADDPLNAPRASLIGRIAAAEDPLVRARYLARHEAATGYADFKDFAFYRIDLDHAHLVEGFGRIIDVPGSALVTDWSGAEAVREAHEGIVSHMNADHADAVSLYATVLAGAADGAWRMVGLDPEGFEITSGPSVRRLAFSDRKTDVGAVRKDLVALVEQARSSKAA